MSPDINAVDDVKIADFGEGIKLPEDELALGLRGSPSYIGAFFSSFSMSAILC